jgi:hypothetical protein
MARLQQWGICAAYRNENQSGDACRNDWSHSIVRDFFHGQISKGLEWQYRGPPCLVECPETRLSVTRARINDSAIGSNTVINASHVATDPIDYVVTDIFGATALDMNGDRRGPYIRFRSAGSNIARA